MAEGGLHGEYRLEMMRFQAMESETTDPLARRLLHDIIEEMEQQLQREFKGPPPL